MSDSSQITHKLLLGDCLEEMPNLESSSVDLILTDLPYGVTQNSADVTLPLNKLWKQWKRILKPNGAVVLTSQFPFTIDVINSNRDWFKYDIIWNKVLVSGFLNANRMPLRSHEHILVFYNSLPTYNPQKIKGLKSHSRGNKMKVDRRNYGKHKEVDNSEKHGTLKFPTSILRIPKPHASKALHPTEKPVSLAEWLIKTYTNQGDTVLDCCMGVGWTAVACKRLGRNFIGVEINQSYFDTTRHRLGETTICLETIMEAQI